MVKTKEDLALERLKTTLLAEGYFQDVLEDIAVIENKLNRLKELEIMYSSCVIEGAKQKKALEIIKREMIDIVALISSENLFMYNTLKRNVDTLTQEEYELLKEVL